MFGIPNEVITAVLTAIAVILARRFGINLPFDVQPHTPPVDPATPEEPAEPLDMEALIEQALLTLVNKLYKREELPPGPRAQVEQFLQDLNKKA